MSVIHTTADGGLSPSTIALRWLDSSARTVPRENITAAWSTGVRRPRASPWSIHRGRLRPRGARPRTIDPIGSRTPNLRQARARTSRAPQWPVRRYFAMAPPAPVQSRRTRPRTSSGWRWPSCTTVVSTVRMMDQPRRKARHIRSLSSQAGNAAPGPSSSSNPQSSSNVDRRPAMPAPSTKAELAAVQPCRALVTMDDRGELHARRVPGLLGRSRIDVAEHEPDPGVALERLEHPGDPVDRHDAVVVGDGDDLRRGQGDTLVATATRPRSSVRT